MNVAVQAVEEVEMGILLIRYFIDHAQYPACI